MMQSATSSFPRMCPATKWHVTLLATSFLSLKNHDVSQICHTLFICSFQLRYNPRLLWEPISAQRSWLPGWPQWLMELWQPNCLSASHTADTSGRKLEASVTTASQCLTSSKPAIPFLVSILPPSVPWCLLISAPPSHVASGTVFSAPS
jgi:hypothetical protein